jgi:hypothetical protein
MTKQNLAQLVEHLPENFSLEEVVDRIILLFKIEKGFEQSELKNTVSTKEAREKLKSWLR